MAILRGEEVTAAVAVQHVNDTSQQQQPWPAAHVRRVTATTTTTAETAPCNKSRHNSKGNEGGELRVKLKNRRRRHQERETDPLDDEERTFNEQRRATNTPPE